MTLPTPPRSPQDIEPLRRKFYNARVVQLRPVHEDLLVVRVAADSEPPRFDAGQYTLLGLGNWERRCDDVATAFSRGASAELIRRPYSIACPMIDSQGQLVTCGDCDFLEFYVTLVHKPTDEPPPLTPRLFGLKPGDRLYLGPHPHGHYTIAPVKPDDDLIFAATGTGEAPHNAMIAELLAHGHRGRIVSVVCVRYWRDMAYLDVHRELEQRYSNYQHFALTTREAINLDRSHPEFVGKQYLQDFFASGRFERRSGLRLHPDGTHAYLCGSPAMIGLPRESPDGQLVFPEPPGMAEVLVGCGFRLDEPRRPGDVHVEKYW